MGDTLDKVSHAKFSMAQDSLRKKRKDKYAHGPDIKEKNRQIYQRNKEKIKERNKRWKSLYFPAGTIRKGITQNILHKSVENLDELGKIFEQSAILCDHCKVEHGPNAILIHIGKSYDCKSYYGPKYEKIKEMRKKYVLVKKKERYDSNT